MLSTLSYFVFVAQLPLAQAGQLLLVTGIAFAVITLIASTYRFHRLIQLDESALPTAEQCDDFFFIQVTRYLSKINRSSSGFGIFIAQFLTAATDRREVQERLLRHTRRIIREQTDKVCLFHDDCIGIIIDTEEKDIPETAVRLLDDLRAVISALPEITAIRIGAASFPTHGLSTQIMIDRACRALERTDFHNDHPLSLAPSPSDEENKKPSAIPEEIGELSKEDKNSALDPLTGVLRPAVIGSYMRKYLAELRRVKQPAALLCLGINRIDHIIELHGEAVADDVIAGVGKVLQKFTRDSDLIGRYQRDDFLILAPCTLEQGEQIALRLRDAVQKEIFLSAGKQMKTSVSIGITAYPNHGRLLRDLFRYSSRALEIIRKWDTSACLVYDPAQHSEKTAYETRR